MTPTKEGFFWGRWHTPCAGTRDIGECCPGAEWEVHHVVVNTIDPSDDEHLMAMVPGVEKWQPLDAFEWGEEIAERRI